MLRFHGASRPAEARGVMIGSAHLRLVNTDSKSIDPANC
jgi:hypothetical protein